MLRSAAAAAAAALVVVAVAAYGSTLQPDQFEAAFQGRCGAGSPCAQLCRELHDGTFECGCGPGYVLHKDGYGCAEVNSSRSAEVAEDDGGAVLYHADVSLSAELEVAPAAAPSPRARATVPPAALPAPAVLGEQRKHISGLRTLLEEGVDADMSMMEDARDTTPHPRPRPHITPKLKVPPQPQPPPTPASACPAAHCHADKGYGVAGSVHTARFAGAGWLALGALRGAYKRVRLRLRFRPERARGVLLLTGEHDDLSGDYLALILRGAHVELRFDCGSGAGVLVSSQPVRLGRWNTVSVYRHRWDAWLKLNQGKRVRARSKGLFSRMTFREPVWVGGAGNTSGLQTKLQLSEGPEGAGGPVGLVGCVDYLRINANTYHLVRDAIATKDVAECAPMLPPWPWQSANEVTDGETTEREVTANEVKLRPIVDVNDLVHYEGNDLVMRDSTNERNDLDNSVYQLTANNNVASRGASVVNVPVDMDNQLRTTSDDERTDMAHADEFGCQCHHGGDCVGGACLCPLGYAGAACEITLDLKVPRFNGSSYLRLPTLGKAAESRTDIQITLKPVSGSGLVLFGAELAGGDGDFFSLHLRDYFVEFAFDLGAGIALVRSGYRLEAGRWHRVSVSRVGRHATLRVREVARTVTSRGAPARLTLRQPLLLGGAPHPLPPRLALTTSFSGCVSKLVINDVELAVVSAALGGVNVDNCDTDITTCSDESLCKEILTQTPQYPQNISRTDVHASIVPKKGFKHNSKTKKHSPHMEKYKRKKYYPNKKETYLKRSNEVITEEPYDGQTYMQIKYLDDKNDVNLGDANTYPSFSGQDSFIHIDDDETMKRLQSYSLDINIRFRSEAPTGLLVWSGRAPTPSPGPSPYPHHRRDFLSLAIEGGVLVFRYELGAGEVEIVANHTRVDDGLWHRARASRNRQAGVLEVDGLGSMGKISPGKMHQLSTQNGLYIGGLPSIELTTLGRYRAGLRGCVSQLSLSGDFDIPLTLSRLPHTITSDVGRCEP